MKKAELISQIKSKSSFLSVGLDSDIKKIPKHLLGYDDPVYEFNKQIIDATAEYCVSYKINTAFYESRGLQGWQSMEKTLAYIPKTHFTIADAKRGDIGNTSEMYAKAFFDPAASGLGFHSITVAPYMGADSVKPFLNFPDKWVILLALTSNPGSNDFQQEQIEGFKLFEVVLKKSMQWGSDENMMYVVGATQGDMFSKIREIVPDHFLLVPGVGAQGGDLELVCKNGLNRSIGLLVAVSRAIIFASDKEDYAEQANVSAKATQKYMKRYLEEYL
ncbi:MAG: orotidine-5'-phosphate decarboxylase [Bacteroidota bacterium]|nr:orotidine-5'-phosphate decarboxylase [Bacteroidota bacterium]